MRPSSRNPVLRYMNWLHTRWPAGTVERLPEVREDGSTAVPGLYVVGDLTGIPLLKFSADTGARAVQTIAADERFQQARKGLAEGVHELVIIGAGVSGMAAALEARHLGIAYRLLEATQTFSTVVNFPRGKPIYTYPKDMTPAGQMHFHAEVKEALVDEMREQTRDVAVTMARVESVARSGGGLRCRLEGGEELAALRVIVAIGRSGNFRKLNVPGEDLDKVYNRLHDPRDYAGKRALVVGGGDSALETAIALTQAGAEVTLSYRKPEFSRPKPDNLEMIQALVRDPSAHVAVEHPSSERVTTAAGEFMEGAKDQRPGHLRLMMSSALREIRPAEVVLADAGGQAVTLGNDVVFSMIGREAPLSFLRRSGLRISGEWTWRAVVSCALFLVFCAALYNWKSGGALQKWTSAHGLFPHTLSGLTNDYEAAPGQPGAQAAVVRREPWQYLDPQPARPPGQPRGVEVGPRPRRACGFFPGCVEDRTSLVGAIVISASGPSFYYTLAYSTIIVVFGIRRMRRRRTPYVKWQTLSLMAVQVVPLFLLPEVIFPLLGYHGLLPRSLADELFPAVSYGHGREYWRAYGLILAWPLFVYNVFTDQPLWGWLGISLVQTFVVLPGVIYLYGKGVYCGWICSCGALAETLGDEQRTKMPHGPWPNRLNMIGQGVLLAALLLLLVRIAGWVRPSLGINQFFPALLDGTDTGVRRLVNYKWIVDVTMGGVLGVGFYFWLSGRVWCRFACPLAALMHIYARFSRFRIFADKKKCISCNVCTSVCHMGIDVMNFANKGLPMQDPECVRCSACVSSCPTGVLTFGQADRDNGVLKYDSVAASLVQIRENPAARRATPR